MAAGAGAVPGLTAASLPLHSAVWEDQAPVLSSLLVAQPVVGLEARDTHGRTPLMLAVSILQSFMGASFNWSPPPEFAKYKITS